MKRTSIPKAIQFSEKVDVDFKKLVAKMIGLNLSLPAHSMSSLARTSQFGGSNSISIQMSKFLAAFPYTTIPRIYLFFFLPHQQNQRILVRRFSYPPPHFLRSLSVSIFQSLLLHLLQYSHN